MSQSEGPQCRPKLKPTAGWESVPASRCGGVGKSKVTGVVCCGYQYGATPSGTERLASKLSPPFDDRLLFAPRLQEFMRSPEGIAVIHPFIEPVFFCAFCAFSRLNPTRSNFPLMNLSRFQSSSGYAADYCLQLWNTFVHET